MNRLTRLVAIATLGLLSAAAASADTLELKDGRVLAGHFLGGTKAMIRFEVNGEVQTFSVTQAVAITFNNVSNNGPSDAPPPPQNPPDAPAPPPPSPDQSYPNQSYPNQAPPPQGRSPYPNQPPANQAPPPALPPQPQTYSSPAPPPQAPLPAPVSTMVTVPSGQSLLVRMIDSVDSSKNRVGDVFRASLETDLIIDNRLIAHKGADVYGRLSAAQEAGHISGSAELQLELTRLVIDGRDYPLVSSDYTLVGKGRGEDSAKKVGGGAVLGAIIGAIAGGGKGAAIGAGVGGATGAGVQVLTRGKEVKVPSETLLEFRLQQPATVTPAQR